MERIVIRVSSVKSLSPRSASDQANCAILDARQRPFVAIRYVPKRSDVRWTKRSFVGAKEIENAVAHSNNAVVVCFATSVQR